MTDGNQDIMTEKDHELFLDIAKDVRKNPARYREDGKWLDEYCSEDAYWQRQETKLEELQRKEKECPVLGNIQRVKQLEEKIKDKRTPALARRFQEARDLLLKRYEDQQFIPEKDARRIIIITWLLTDPDAEKSKLNITQFEKWPWEPIDDVIKMSRGYANFLWFHGGKIYSPWMNLVRIALAKLRAEDGYEVDSSQIQDKKGTLAKNFLDNLLRASVKHLPFCGSFLYDVIYGTIDSQKSKKEIEAQSEPTKSQQISTKKKEDINSTRDNKKWYQTHTCKFVIIPIIVTLFLGIPAWLSIFGWPKGLEESISTNEPNQETAESSQLVTSLWEICQDIDNRPLLQKEQTAKSYEGIRINKEPLNIDHIIVEDETFRILTIFPGEPYRPFLGGWGVSFEVKKDQYPELISAKKGLCLYVTGRIKSASENSIEIDETIIELK